jgi:hypothetical protein
LHQYAPPTFHFSKVVHVEEPDTMPYTEEPPSPPDNNKKEEDEDDDAKEKIRTQDPTESTNHSNRQESKMEAYPVCWFEDENTQQPLRWQYFAGVLYDSLHYPPEPSSSSSSSSLSTGNDNSLPWKIRLHFQSYPSQQLLELDPTSGVLTTVERTFKNSLKQALTMIHGNSKPALNMTKQSHQTIWTAIETSNYDLFRPILRHEIQPKDDQNLEQHLLVPKL